MPKAAATHTKFSGQPSSAARWGDYFALLKPRVMSLVIFTALVGMVAAPGSMNLGLAAASLFAIAVGAGASGALNMWWDADIDALMSRTATRPIPIGAVPSHEAAAFGLLLSGLAVALLALASNYLAAGLLAFTIFFYAVIYSMWLKRSTPQNIVIGGAAGALPPVVGWAAVTGTAPLEAWVLFAIIFLWTPPHFWALALFRQGDYARAGVPMLPVVRGERETRRQIFLYGAILAGAGATPYLVGMASIFYFVLSSVLGGVFVWRCWRVLKGGADDRASPKALFSYSIFYLFAMFAGLLIDRLAALLL